MGEKLAVLQKTNLQPETRNKLQLKPFKSKSSGLWCRIVLW